MSHSFRLCFTLPTHIALGIDTDSWLVEEPPDQPRVVLCSRTAGQPISKSRALELCSQGYESRQQAFDAGLHYRDMLMFTSAYLRLGLSFDQCPPESQAGWSAQTSDGQADRSSAEDCPGLRVYPSDAEPPFADASEERVWPKPSDRFERVLQRMLQEKPQLNHQGRLAYELFSSSFSQKTPETRFLLLMQAMLILQVQHLRSAISVAHIDGLIEKTSRCPDLTAGEQATMALALEHMKHESIVQGGCRMVERLGNREYGNLPARTFWLRCAAIKGRLTYESDKPVSHEEFEVMNPPLEAMVGDLLCGLQYIREQPLVANAAAKTCKPQARRSAGLQPALDPD